MSYSSILNKIQVLCTYSLKYKLIQVILWKLKLEFGNFTERVIFCVSFTRAQKSFAQLPLVPQIPCLKQCCQRARPNPPVGRFVQNTFLSPVFFVICLPKWSFLGHKCHQAALNSSHCPQLARDCATDVFSINTFIWKKLGNQLTSRLEICHDRHNQKIFSTCVNFLENKAFPCKIYVKIWNLLIYLVKLHTLSLKHYWIFTSFFIPTKEDQIIYIKIYAALLLAKKYHNLSFLVCKIFGPKFRPCNFFLKKECPYFWELLSLN